MNFSQLMSLATGHVEARIVQTALELKLFEALQGAAQAAEKIAEGLNLDRRATELLLNALCALELLHKDGDAFSL